MCFSYSPPSFATLSNLASKYYLNISIKKNLTKPEFLGRILGLEYSLARVSETIIAFAVGKMVDKGRSTNEISFFSAGIALFFVIFWGTYHATGRGAAQVRFNIIGDGSNCTEKKTFIEYEDEP